MGSNKDKYCYSSVINNAVCVVLIYKIYYNIDRAILSEAQQDINVYTREIVGKTYKKLSKKMIRLGIEL